jgi:hypothetical protein
VISLCLPIALRGTPEDPAHDCEGDEPGDDHARGDHTGRCLLRDRYHSHVTMMDAPLALAPHEVPDRHRCSCLGNPRLGDLVSTHPIYRANGPNCCPTGGFDQERWHWNGSRFVRIRLWHTKSYRA